MYNQHNNTIKSFRKVYLFSILLLSISLNANASTYDENRNTIISNNDKNKVNASEHASNLITLAPETIPVGSLIIPMDNTLQGDGSEFNLKAYGALVRLLHANIPLKWAIRPGKTNGGIDFTALSTQVDPATGGTIGVSSSTSYIASAFIVSPDFRDAALEVIDNYNNTISDDINVYQLDAAPSFPASGQVDIYATLLHKPYAASLQNGKGSIHTGVYASAGLEENVHYEEVNDAASLTNSSCYTFANEPHASVSDSQITAVRNFVQNGGNFLAQCAGARAYDDDSSSATERLITSGGLVDESGEGGTITMNNSNADNPVVQIDGTISDEGGSLKAFTTTPITAGATDEELYATQTDGDNKLWGARINGLTGTYGSNGGFVFYLAGHKYGSSNSNGINGRRILLNALMLPPSRPTSCGFDIPISAPNLSIGDVTVDEGNSASFVLTLDNSYNEDIDVVLERINNTTTNADYNFTIPSTQPSVFTFTIPANTTTANIPFDAIDDGISELPETFNLNIQSANAGAVDITVTDPTGLGTINNINLPNVSISDDTDYEGSTIILTVSLDGPYTQDVVVDFNVTDGTAIAPGDYTVPAITQVTIPSGSTSTTINVVTIVDPPTETTEFFNVNLTSALSGITLIPIVDNLGIGNITDNSLYTVSIDDVTVTEGNPANFTVTRTGNLVVGLPFPLHIDYEIIPNTATGGSVDYDDPPPPTPPTPPLTSEYQFIMPGNDLTATLTVPTISDNIYEGSENYTVRITKAYAVAFFFSVFELPIPITDSDGLGIILDDEPLPRVDINNVTVTEGNPANFQLSLVNPGTSLPITSSEDITVTFDVNNGTAIAGSDYTVPSQLSVVIPAGNSTANITIPTINDNIYELTENFTVNMTSAVTNITSTAITIGTNPGTGTITDNDPIPTISISGDTVDEGDLLDFLVTLSSPINTDVFYAFSLADNTATTPADYIVPTTLAGTIFAGSTQSTITVETVDDFISEPTEDMLANIDNTIAIIGITPIPITITTPQATGIINDNDSTPSITIGNLTVNENVGNASVSITLSGTSSVATAVNISTSNGTAVEPGDYTSTTTSVTIPAGSTSTTVSIPIIDDTIDEPNENFTVNGTVTSGNTSNVNPSGTVTITDNDPTPTITINDLTVNENVGNASVSITLSGASSLATAVNISTSNGTAVEPGDYTSTTTSVTIPAGNTSTTVSIPIIDDTIDEPNENFTVNGAVTSGNTSNVNPSGTVTITDNDPTPTITINDLTVNENVGNASVSITLSGASSVATAVNISTSNGTAVEPGDYTSTTTSVTIPAGNTSTTVSIPIIDDTIDEPNENFTVNGTVTSGNTSNVNPSGTVTITDNDGAPNITINDLTVNENVGNASVSITLSGASSVATTINITTSDNTAIEPGDYTSTTTSVTIPAGSLSTTVSIPIIDDTIDEPNENFTVNGTVTSGNTSNVNPSGTVTITDNDPTPTITINDLTVNENVGNASVSITLSGTSSVATAVNISTSNGTAVEPGDYTSTTTSVTIPAGSTSTTVSIPIIDDTIDEPNENFTVNGTVTSGNTSNVNPSGTVTITDNDPTPTITINDLTVNENVGNASVSITLSGTSSVATAVNISTSNGTAVEPGDYTSTTTSVTIPAGSTSTTVSIPIIDDTIDEPNENFTVNGTVTSGNTSNVNPSGTVTITDNDPTPTITINDLTVNENVGNASVSITLSGASSVATTINITTSDNTAIEPGDYTSTTTSVTIPAGNTSTTVNIPIIDDTIDEPNENFTVNGTVTSGNTSNVNPSGTVTITDNDPTPTITINDLTVNENVGNASVSITLSGASSVATAVNISTSNGTAVEPGDYTSTTTSVTIPAGNTSTTVSIPIIDDTIDEPNENFTVNGTVTSGNTSNVNPSGTVTITDNDPTPTITINDLTVNENVGNASVSITLSGTSSVATAVNISTSNGTAVEPGDYTSTTTSVTIPAGSTSTTVSIPIIDDTIDEPNENFTVNGTVTSGNTSNVNPSGTVTITDNDPTPTITINNLTVNENVGNASVSITLSGTSSVATTINITTSDNTAIEPGDYTSTTTSVTIPAGSTSTTVSIPIIDDTIDEPNENFTVNGTVTSGNTSNVNPSGTVTITDNDPTPTITINDLTVNENVGLANVSISLSGASSVITVINISTSNGSATAPNDYINTISTAIIPAGSTSTTVNIPIIDDTIDEPNENFTVNGTVTSGNTSNTNPTGTVTITDNDPTPTITIDDLTVNENVGNANVSITLSGASSGPTTINITTSDNTAIEPGDYTSTTTSVTIPAGGTSTTVSIPIIDDTIDEPNENFIVNGTVTSGNTSNTNPTGTVTITDNDPTPIITINNLTVNENVGNASVSITLSGTSSVATTINITTSDNTAIEPGDYTSTTTSVTIPAGSTSTTVSIPIIDDTIDEPNENFTVNGAVTSGNTSNINPSGTVTITDNDPTPTITINDLTVNENVGNANVSISLSGASSVITVINISTSNGSATAPNDYINTISTAIIPAGSTSTTVNIPIIDDTIDEPNENFTVNGTVTSGNTSNTNPTGTVTITDNDPTPTITIDDLTVNENVGNANVSITLSGASSGPTTINITTSDNTAIEPGDYTSTTTSVTIPAGSTSTTVSIPIIDDTIDEPNENFIVNGTVTSGNTSNTNPTGTVTITDNDPTPIITINNLTVNENVGNASVSITLSGTSSVATTINITTSDNTAIEPGDYTSTTTSVTIPAGSTSTTVSIPIIDDTIDEPNENFTVNGAVTSGNTSNINPSGTVTITDNDPTPTITINDLTVNENVGNANVSISLSGASSVITVINISTSNGSATAPNDYINTISTAIIPAGSTSTTVNIPIIDDTIDEPNENFTVNGTVTSGNTSNTNPTGTVTITDNDPTPTITIDDLTVNENVGNANVSITLSGASSGPTTINITTSDNTAIEPGDYTSTTTSVTIPAGGTSTTVSIPIIDDTIDEPNENFIVNGTVTSGNTSNTNPTGTVTITDNDPTPIITINNLTVNENVGNASVSITLSGTSSVATTINITTSNNTAIEPGDYTSTTTSVTIPAGSTSTTVSIPIIDDTIDEPNENFTVNGAVTSGNTSNINPSGTVTITDNDPTPTITINDLTVNENVGNANVSISLSGASSVITVINISTSNGSATAPNDYINTISTVIIPAGSTSTTVNIPIIDDNIGESNENFTVNGTVTSGNTSNTSPSGTVTINDNFDIDLNLTKNVILITDGDNSGGISAGDTVTFTVTVNNNGPNDATGIGVGDIVPDGYTSVANISNGGNISAGVILWSGLSLNAGNNLDLTYNAVVTATGNYTNFAELTSVDQIDIDSTPDSTPDTDPPSEDDETSETPIVNSVSDIEVNKSVVLTTDADGSTNPTPGDTVTFTVTVNNNGPNDATGVQLTDQVPNGYTIVGTPTVSQGTYTVGSGLWDIGTLNNAANATLTIVATINATGNYVNVAELTASNNFDPNSTPNNNDPTEDDQSEVDPGVSPVSNIDVNKSVVLTTDADGSTNPTPGDTVTFTVIVNNSGPNDATGVQVTDQVPNGYTIVGTPTASQGTYTVASGLWDIGTINNAANATLTIVATINATGDYVNVAELTASNNFDPNSTPNNNDPTEDDQSEVDPGVSPVSNIDVNKSVILTTDADGSTNPTPGDTVTFTVVVNNSGPNDATGVQVTDLLPNGYTIVGAPTTNLGTYNPGSGLWDIGTINNAANATLNIIATINATGDYVNVAELTASNNFDPNSTPNNNDPTEDDQSEVDPGVSPVSNIDVNKSVVLTTDADGSTNPTPGDTVTFTVVVNNSGPNDATGVQVTDQVPNGYTIVGTPTASQGTYTVASGLWDIGTINNAANATLTIVATINATGDYVNVAELTASNNFDPNSTPNNNDPTEDDQSEVDPGVSPVSNIDVNKSVVLTTDADGSTNPTPGDTVTFTVIVNNSGPNDATGVQVTDQVPNGYTIVGTPTASQGTYTVASGLWDIGTINNAANATLTIVATINATGDYVNVAELTASNNFDPNSTPNNNDPTEDDQSEVDPGVSPVSNIDVNKSVILTTDADGSTNPTPGDTVTFTVVVNNSGPNDATGVQVTDLLPNGYTIVGAPTTNLGTYNPGSGLWDIGTINNAANATLNIIATINATGDYVNVAELTASNNFDPNSTPNNNDPTEDDQSEVDPGVSPVSNIDVNKSVVLTTDADGSTNPTPGDTVTFTVVVNNSGPNDATGVQVTDQVPNGYTIVGTPTASQGTYTVASGLWDIGTINNAANATLTIVATINATGDYVNVAELTASNNFDPNSTPNNNDPTEDDQSEVDPGVSPVSNIDVNKSVVLTTDADGSTNPTPGDTVTFTVIVNNSGPNDANGVQVTDQVPNGYTIVGTPTASQGTYTVASGLWDIGTINNAANATLTIVATINATGDYVNVAELTASNNFDPNSTPNNNDPTEDDQSEVDPGVSPVSNIDVNKSVVLTTDADGSTNPTPGDTVTFTVTVTNSGPNNATGVQVTDLLPNGYTIVGAPTANQGIYTIGTGLWDIGTLNNATNATLNIIATINATGDYVNVAELTASNNFDPNSTPNNNDPTEDDQSEVNLTVSPVSNIDVNKSVVLNIDADGSTNPTPGDTVTFTVTVTNSGPNDATGVQVTDQVPNGYTIVGTPTASQGTYTVASGLWDIGTINNAANATLTIVATINATGDYVNVAELTASNNFDPNSTPNNNDPTEDDQSEVDPGVSPVSNIDVNKSVVLTTDADGSTNPTPGDTVTFTVIVNNSGPNDANGVQVTDQVPNGYTIVGAPTASQGTYTVASGLWDIGTINNAANATLTIVATINATGDYVNVAELTASNNFDPNSTPNNNDPTEDDQSEVDPGVSPVSNIDVNKSVVLTTDADGSTNPTPGDTVTFTVTVTNSGPNNATGVQVTDLLPNGYTIVGAPTANQGIYTIGTGLWDIGTLNNATNATLNIIATINATGDYVNVAELTASNNFDPNSTPNNNDPTEDDQSEVNLTVSPVSNIDVNKSVVLNIDADGSTNPTPGDTVTFTVTVTNSGPNDATGVQVTDQVPNGYTIVGTPTASQGTYTVGSGLWDIGTLNNAANATLTIVATINATGDYVNVAELTASNNFDPNSTPNNNDPTEDDQSEVDPGVSPVSNIDVNKSVVLTTDADGSTNPTPGDTVTFTVIVNNSGPNDANGVQVTDQVPNGYTIVGAPTASQGTYTIGSGLWDIGTINNAANATLTIVATINATGDYVNVAELTASNNFDPNSTPNNNDPTEDDQSEVDPGVSPVSNIDVNKSAILTTDADGSTNPTPGDTVTFTVTVTNSGPNNATGVQVTDLLPNGYTIVGAPTANQGIYTIGTGLWDIGTLNNATNATLNIIATINATGDYVNVAELTASNNFDPNSTPNNNDPTEDDQSEVNLTVSPVSNIDVNKSVVLNIDADGSTNPTPGDTVTFTVTVTNSGPNDATGVQVTDQVPNGYTIVGTPTASQGTYTVGSGLWDIGTLNNAANATLTIVATINATGDYVNVAELTASNNFDPNSTPNNNDPTEDDQSEVDPGVSPVSNIDVNKSVVLTTDADGSTNASPGDTVTYTVTVNNSGPNDATGVQVTDMLPNGFTLVGTPTASQGTYTVASGIWDIGTINNAANATLTIVATINATGDYVNVAELTASDNFDPNSTPNNNDITEDDQSEVNLTVSPVSNIDVNKSVVLTTDADGSTNPTPGDTVTFTVTVNNSGPNDATGVQVTDQVPNGYTIIGTPIANLGTYNTSSGLWDIGTINNAANATLNIIATINATGDYVNVAELTASNNFDPNSTPNNNDPTEDDQSEVDPGVSPVSDIEILKSVALTNDVDGNSVISAGDTITFSITLSNAGPNDATGIAVGDTVPDGYSSIASINNGGSESSGLISWSGLNVPIATPLVLSYTVVVTDTGNYTNFAEITASDYFDPDSTPDSTPDTDTPTEDDETNFTPSIPELTLTKTSSVGGDGELGDTITYTFIVENTGNSTISNIIIDDPLTGSVDLPVIPSTIAAGEVGFATVNYTITQNDIDQGEVINSATVIGEDPNGDDVIDISDNGDETVDDDGDGDPTNDITVTPVEKRLNLALTKTGNYIDTNNDGFPNSGDEIHYTFTVENVGNVDVTDILLTDELPGIEISGQPIDLSIGEIDSDTFTATYILTQEDILAGQVTNQATVTGIGPIGDTVIDLSDDPNDPTDIDLDGDGDFEDETIVTVVSDEDDGIIIYEGISPDNNGKNDDFRIVGLNNFPNNTLNIFNRWGVLVFEQDRYEQPESKLFNGVSDGRLTIKRGDKLPTGTYYYILKYTLPSGKIKSRAGYFYLNR